MGLPELATIRDHRYQNVLCSAVLMHVQRENLIGVALNLARILQRVGRLILSYRASAMSIVARKCASMFETA